MTRCDDAEKRDLWVRRLIEEPFYLGASGRGRSGSVGGSVTRRDDAEKRETQLWRCMGEQGVRSQGGAPYNDTA